MKKHITLIILSLIFLASNAKPLPFPVKFTNAINADEGIKLKLTLGGKSYDLISYNLSYIASDKSKADAPGSTSIITTSILAPTVNNLNVSLRTSKLDQELMDWILAPSSSEKDGQVQIIDTDAGKVLKTITFNSLKPANYSESFYNNGGINVNIQTTATFNMHFTKISIKQ